MKAFTVEWVQIDKHAVPVVRLPEVDTVIAEAVWAMEYVIAVQRLSSHPDYQRAQAFLASQVVTEWRKRQEERKVSDE
jgi:hypothetical protein